VIVAYFLGHPVYAKYASVLLDVPIDINECQSTNNCSELATCHNIEGDYSCACNIGYSGGGFNCYGEITAFK